MVIAYYFIGQYFWFVWALEAQDYNQQVEWALLE